MFESIKIIILKIIPPKYKGVPQKIKNQKEKLVQSIKVEK
jgi:hypothetical protein